jgi:hypothetical protein
MNPNPYHPPHTDSALRHEPPVLAQLARGAGLAVEFQLEPADVALFVQYHDRASRTRWWYGQMALATITVFIIIGLLSRKAIDDPKLWPVVAAIALIFGLYLLLFLIPRSLRRSVFQGLLRKEQNHLLFVRTQVAITSDFLNYATPYSQSLMRWMAIEKVLTSSEAVYFYLTSETAHVVPRRAFSSDDHFQTFAQTAQEFHTRALAAENPLRTSKT